MTMATVIDTFGALELARAAAIEDSHDPKFVGEFISIDLDTTADEADGARIASYLFESSLPGYSGWRWAVTIAKVDEQSAPTICDVVLLPGVDSLLAPEWVAYKDRILPGDVGVGDIVPTAADDPRLVPGFASLPGDEDLDALDLNELFEFGLGRARVLSIEGRDAAAQRWYDGDRGPNTPIAQYASKSCQSCGFFIPIAGSLRSAFGVCANALAPDDARVVSVDHGCGAHSEALIVTE
jgi:hypothetical protein